LFDLFIETFFRGLLWEFIAALAGSYYLWKIKNVPFINKIFVWFLWLTLVIDFSGLYMLFGYYSNYKYFAFVKGTRFVQNYWLFNSYHLIAYCAFLAFFISHLSSKKWRKRFWIITWLFSIIAILNLIFSGVFFTGYAAFTAIGGTLILLFCIALFFFQVLRGDKILNFYSDLAFYVAIGALLWHVSITPLFIYNKYGIMSSSPDFVNFYKGLLLTMNVFMYGCFAAGFIIKSKSRYIAKEEKRI